MEEEDAKHNAEATASGKIRNALQVTCKHPGVSLRPEVPEFSVLERPKQSSTVLSCLRRFHVAFEGRGRRS